MMGTLCISGRGLREGHEPPKTGASLLQRKGALILAAAPAMWTLPAVTMRLPRVLSRFLQLGATASLVLAVGASQALAVILDAAPTWPIPPDPPTGRPPIPDLPPATDAPPPSNQILTVWEGGDRIR
jgi:hypothetical protein